MPVRLSLRVIKTTIPIVLGYHFWQGRSLLLIGSSECYEFSVRGEVHPRKIFSLRDIAISRGGRHYFGQPTHSWNARGPVRILSGERSNQYCDG